MANSVTLAVSLLPAERRVLHGALPRLERCAVKVARTVLRGRGGGNVTPLPDPGTGRLTSSGIGSSMTIIPVDHYLTTHP